MKTLSAGVQAGDGRFRVEPRPAFLAIDAAARGGVYAALAIKGRLDTSGVSFIDLNADKSAAAADALGINIGVVIGHAGVLQRAQDSTRRAASRGAGDRADSGGSQPTGCDDRRN